MAEFVINSTNYDEAREELLKSLRELATTLSEHLGKSFKYRLVSQLQADAFEREAYRQSKSGNIGAPPFGDVAAFRAAIYNQAAAAKQLEAFIRVSRVVSLELCQAAIRGFEAEEVAVPSMMLRGLVERTAHAVALANALEGFAEVPAPLDRPNGPLLDLGDTIGKALYQTRVNWQKLFDVDWQSTSNKQMERLKEDITPIKEELTMDVHARSIETFIEKLNKRVPGILICYHVLCEFLHPNVGDLFSATVRASSQNDAYGTLHLLRELGLGPKDVSTAPDLERIQSRVLLHCCEALRLLPQIHEDLETASRTANRMAKNFAHIVRKKYRPFFKTDDLCPCLSGLRIGSCK